MTPILAIRPNPKTLRRRGSAVVEFTLIGIPLLFVIISLFEVSRGIWMFHTLHAAVREGARYVSVHGQNCNVAPNTCGVTVRQIATRIRDLGTGLLPQDVRQVTLTSPTRTITCSTLSQCLDSGSLGDTYWPASAPGQPPDAGSAPGVDVQIYAQLQMRLGVAMFWPGTPSTPVWAPITIDSQARERIQF